MARKHGAHLHRLITALGLLGGLVLSPLGLGHAVSSSAAGTGWSVSVTPSTNLSDGQSVQINVKTTTGYTLSGVIVRLCRHGAKLQPSALGAAQPNDDFTLNCPFLAVSSSAQAEADDFGGSLVNASTAGGETFLYAVGTGVVTWHAKDGSSQTLTCDTQNPCDVGVEVWVGPTGQPPAWQPVLQPITYANNDPIAGCGGTANGVLSSGGSDRMTESWINWTLGECVLPGRKGAATRSSFLGEGPAVSSFAGGGLDLAYTAGGYDSVMGLLGSGQLTGGPRPAVAIPIALNATVLAVREDQNVNGHQVPITSLQLTAADIAAILNSQSGESAVDGEIIKRNPQLGAVFGPRYQQLADPAAVAYPVADSNSWYMTRMVTELAPSAWVVPAAPLAFFGQDAGKQRGVVAALGLASPSFIHAINLVNGRPPIQKIIVGADPTQQGGLWLLTDMETASKFGMTPAQVETAPGSKVFVGPTAATMMAALPTMAADSNGVLIGADPKALAAKADPAVYPMTYVEYALVPTQPLLNDDCTTRDASQALLKGWLKYLTGAGQSQLPAGMVPLTSGLQTAAAQAIAQVGAAAVTAAATDVTPSGNACSTVVHPAPPAPTTTAATTSATTTRPLPTSISPTGSYPSGNSSQPIAAPNAPVIAVPVTSAPVGTAPPSSTLPATIVLPAFAGRTPLRYGGTVVGLVGIIALSALAAASRTTSGLAVRRRLSGRFRWPGATHRPLG